MSRAASLQHQWRERSDLHWGGEERLDSTADFAAESRMHRELIGLLLLAFAALQAEAAGQTNGMASSGHFELAVPLTPGAAREAGKAGQRVASLRAVVDLPPGFDHRKPWPVLLVCAPSGASAVASTRSYTNVAWSMGWIVTAVDGPKVATQQDDSSFAWEMIGSLLVYLRASWPQSKQWPFACAGFSGGAKRAAMIGAQMQRRGDLVIGVFMGGCNEDRATLGYRIASPGSAYLNVPMFLSNGTRDPIANVAQGEKVRDLMLSTGFRQVRLESYNGEHRLDTNNLRMALEWFRRK